MTPKILLSFVMHRYPFRLQKDCSHAAIRLYYKGWHSSAWRGATAKWKLAVQGREYGRGRGPEFRGLEFSHIIRNPGHSQQPGGPNNQEARHPRNRGWENRPPPSSSPAPQVRPSTWGLKFLGFEASVRDSYSRVTGTVYFQPSKIAIRYFVCCSSGCNSLF